GARDEAHLAVLKVVLEAVFTVTSLGSPIVIVNDDGDAVARAGYWIAPFGEIAANTDSLQMMFAKSFEQSAPDCSAADYQAFQISVNGFIDLRPIGIISNAKLPSELHPGAVTIHEDEESFAA